MGKHVYPWNRQVSPRKALSTRRVRQSSARFMGKRFRTVPPVSHCFITIGQVARLPMVLPGRARSYPSSSVVSGAVDWLTGCSVNGLMGWLIPPSPASRCEPGRTRMARLPRRGAYPGLVPAARRPGLWICRAYGPACCRPSPARRESASVGRGPPRPCRRPAAGEQPGATSPERGRFRAGRSGLAATD